MRIVRNNEEKGNVFDKHFRELRNSEAEPSADLWDRIEYKLDEERAQKKHDHWYHALLLLLIPLTAANIYVTYDLKGWYVSHFKGEQEQVAPENPLAAGTLPGQLLASANNALLLDDIILNNRNSAHFLPDAENGKTTASTPLSSAVSSSESILSSGNTNNANNTEDELVSNDLIPIERLMLESSVTTQDVKYVQARNLSEKKKSAIRGFHVGLESGLNNSLILLKENTLAPIVGSNIHRKLDLAPYYGISVGYDFSRKFGVEAEWILHSNQGQKYEELRYNKIRINGEIDLEYMHLPLMLKYKMCRMGGKSLNPRVVNFIAGIQYSRLKEASVTVNDLDLINATKPFNRDELGFLLGIEYDLFVKENYFLTLGTRASISSDLRSFPYFVPEASQTYNVLVGVNASFHYLMKRHK